MKHAAKQRKFGRVKSQREALMMSLAIGLIEHNQIRTTEAKAKSLRPYIEKLITEARKGDMNSTRRIVARLQNNRAVADRLIKEIAPRFADRPGGYTRIIKLPCRAGDASPEAIIQFVS